MLLYISQNLKRESSIIGTAVLQHGYGGSVYERHIQVMQDVFLEHGFQVVNIDTPHSFGESDGEYKDARLGLHADDFEDVANWAREQAWFTGKLLVSGHSMGGFASAHYALQYSDRVDFAIPFAPVVSGQYWLEANLKYRPEQMKKWKEKGVLFEKSHRVSGRVKEKPYEVIIESLNHNLLNEQLVCVKTKVLLIACEKDTSCPVESIETLYQSLAGNKEFKIISGSGHVPRTKEQLQQLSDIIDTWLGVKLKKV